MSTGLVIRPGRRYRMTSLSLLLLLLLSAVVDVCIGIPLKDKRRFSGENNIDGIIQKYDKQFKTFENTTVRMIQPIQTLEIDCNSNNITVEIRAFGKNFQLELVYNEWLIDSTYEEIMVTATGERQLFGNANTTAKHCFYIGYVRNRPGSAAAASAYNGFRAQISTNGELYHVEPVDGTLRGRHRVYRQSDSLLSNTSCGGVKGHGSSHVMKTLERLAKHRSKRATLNWPRDLNGKTRLVELYVANDFLQYARLGSSMAQVIARTKEIYNFASSLYQPLDIYLTLVGIEVWSTGSLIPLDLVNPDFTLGNFTQYRAEKINPFRKNDNAQLLETNQYPGGTIGLAWLGQMCTLDRSAAIVSDVSSVPGYTAAVAAHEMGHNFGFNHDDQLAPVVCTCSDPSGFCIMNSMARQTPATRWSNCSTSVLSSFLSSPASSCLNDFNGVLYDTVSVCGNGIVEAGEQCDCGKAPLSECNPACCNSTTCQLVSSAKCADGLCCDIPNCQLKPITTVCRAANNSCDLAEYCSGTNNTCPSDVFRQNGVECSVSGVSAFCYAGTCRTRATQCQIWWGPSSGEAASSCYTGYNTQGQEYGNCGTVNRTAGIYVPCSFSDAVCGSLQCEVANGALPTVALSGVYSYNGAVGSSTCATPIVPATYDTIPNLGMVPDGAACGATSMCVSQRCVTVASVLSQSSCGSCSQHGVCNSIGQCHCDVGYGPPDCSQPGNGGSYQSNPISILTTTASLTINPGTTANVAATSGNIVVTNLPTTPAPSSIAATTSAAATTRPPTTANIAATSGNIVVTNLPTTPAPSSIAATTSAAATTRPPTTANIAATSGNIVVTNLPTTPAPSSIAATTSAAATTRPPTTANIAATSGNIVVTNLPTTPAPSSIAATTSAAATTRPPTTANIAATSGNIVVTNLPTTPAPSSIAATTSAAATTRPPTTANIAATSGNIVVTNLPTTPAPSSIAATTSAAATTRPPTTANIAATSGNIVVTNLPTTPAPSSIAATTSAAATTRPPTTANIAATSGNSVVTDSPSSVQPSVSNLVTNAAQSSVAVITNAETATGTTSTSTSTSTQSSVAMTATTTASSGLSQGAIIGIAVGSVAAAAVGVGVVAAIYNSLQASSAAAAAGPTSGSGQSVNNIVGAAKPTATVSDAGQQQIDPVWRGYRQQMTSPAANVQNRAWSNYYGNVPPTYHHDLSPFEYRAPYRLKPYWSPASSTNAYGYVSQDAYQLSRF